MKEQIRSGQVSFKGENTFAENVTIYVYGEDEPADDGNCWHYDEDNNIVLW